MLRISGYSTALLKELLSTCRIGVGFGLNYFWSLTLGAKLGMDFKLMNLNRLADFELKYQVGLIYVI